MLGRQGYFRRIAAKVAAVNEPAGKWQDSSSSGSPLLSVRDVKKCGDDLTRENLMRQAANHQKLRVPLLLPGITVNTSPTDFYPVQSVQLASFKGKTWNLFGDIMSAEST